MLRISRLTDYGTVVMAYLANHMGSHTAKDIAQATHIALPTVSKLLKLLARAELLAAQRGAKGGYGLALAAKDISLAKIIQALEGQQIALTECGHHKGGCSMEMQCAIKSNWRMVSEALRQTLSAISLAEMTKPIALTRLKQNLQDHLT